MLWASLSCSCLIDHNWYIPGLSNLVKQIWKDRKEYTNMIMVNYLIRCLCLGMQNHRSWSFARTCQMIPVIVSTPSRWQFRVAVLGKACSYIMQLLCCVYERVCKDLISFGMVWVHTGAVTANEFRQYGQSLQILCHQHLKHGGSCALRVWRPQTSAITQGRSMSRGSQQSCTSSMERWVWKHHHHIGSNQ